MSYQLLILGAEGRCKNSERVLKIAEWETQSRQGLEALECDGQTSTKIK